MKKLYKKGTVHPTPPLLSDQLLSILPATILTLIVALSAEEKEVLAYLISCSSTNFSNNNGRTTHKTSSPSAGSGKVGADHPPSFNCYCFRCYMSYWAKWDSSPNRQLIHEVIDAFEDSLLMQDKKEKGKRERRKGRSAKGSGQASDESKNSELSVVGNAFEESNSAPASTSGGGAETGGGEDDDDDDDDVKEEEPEKGSVRKFVSFLGERIWGVWS